MFSTSTIFQEIKLFIFSCLIGRRFQLRRLRCVRHSGQRHRNQVDKNKIDLYQRHRNRIENIETMHRERFLWRCSGGGGGEFLNG